MRTDIHAFCGIRTHDPSVRAGEDCSCLTMHDLHNSNIQNVPPLSSTFLFVSSSCKLTGTSECIVMEFDSGKFNRIHRENTVLVIKEQRYRTHEDPHAFHALLELNTYQSEKVSKNICRDKWSTYFISCRYFSVSITVFKYINKKRAKVPHLLGCAFVSERGVLKKDKRMRKKRLKKIL
jgi:hypothetical protein